MPDLFEMLNTITRRRKDGAGSPFASVKSTDKWLKNLPSESDYDTHHALVQGLERFNAENEAATISRMKSLMKLETAGLPMQLRVVEQYVRNQAAFRLARQGRIKHPHPSPGPHHPRTGCRHPCTRTITGQPQPRQQHAAR